MKIHTLFAVLLLSSPVSAQTRVAAPISSPVAVLAPLQLGAAPVPGLLALPSLSPSLALSLTPAAALAMPPTVIVQPALAVAVARPTVAVPLPAKLAARADDLGAAKGLKASRMSGADFLAILDEARASAPLAPTPAAAAAAREIETQVVRVARALIPTDKPLAESLSRALAVWQVFDQEMGIAASKGSLAAIVADARLFASQVEASIEPAPAPAPAPALAPAPAREVHPEDPEGYASVAVPGSIFGWKPIAESPNHGLPPLDALIRRVLADKKSPYAKGFELPGALKREDARIYFYGERHTDGALITANMQRLVSDARPGRPMIILVEGYTGWSLRGWPAIKYLADRGLEPNDLTEKGIASGGIEVRGWDVFENYDASKHPLLQHHMDKLALNHLAHGELRGWRYYREFARAALTAWRGFQELWHAALVVRNGDLDRAVSQAAEDADAAGATVHVIAGTDHLMQNPRLVGWPLIGRPSMRKTLRDALGGRPFWASQPPNTLD